MNYSGLVSGCDDFSKSQIWSTSAPISEKFTVLESSVNMSNAVTSTLRGIGRMLPLLDFLRFLKEIYEHVIPLNVSKVQKMNLAIQQQLP